MPPLEREREHEHREHIQLVLGKDAPNGSQLKLDGVNRGPGRQRHA